LNTARIELEYGTTPGNFDIVIHNLHLKKAYLELRDFILKELEAQFKEELLINNELIINGLPKIVSTME